MVITHACLDNKNNAHAISWGIPLAGYCHDSDITVLLKLVQLVYHMDCKQMAWYYVEINKKLMECAL